MDHGHSNAQDWVRELQEEMRQLKPVPVNHKSSRSVFIYKDLNRCSHIFMRTDRNKKPLEPAYEGPFRVITRFEKYFRLEIHGKDIAISIDRLKPVTEEDVNLQDTSFEPLAQTRDDSPLLRTQSTDQEEQPKAPATVPTSTRCGRTVRFPTKYLEEII
ncbi:uncharacterized protein [Halyomorpha halys]|uniref:uncharacterized protein n=1 Tax=Halyomorpha halys TaxID=286706 RepID=UPI0034D30E82